MRDKKLTGVFFSDSVNGQSDVVDISEVATYIKRIPEVAEIWHSSDIQFSDTEKIAAEIKAIKIKRFVVAGDMPGFEKRFFVKVMVSTGNNPEDVILASFREHGAITNADTERAKAIVACAVYGVPFEVASLPEETTVHTETMVIGVVLPVS
ncbi:unnamed protein product, partial [marine sediment metagenome]